MIRAVWEIASGKLQRMGPRLVFRGIIRRGIGLQSCVVGVRRREPDLPILEIGEQFLILLCREFARPKHFRSVNFGAVENPFVMNVMVLLVAYYDKVFAWRVLKFFLNGGAAGIAVASPPQRVAGAMRHRTPRIHREQRNYGPVQRDPNRPPPPPPAPHIPNRL